MLALERAIEKKLTRKKVSQLIDILAEIKAKAVEILR